MHLRLAFAAISLAAACTISGPPPPGAPGTPLTCNGALSCTGPSCQLSTAETDASLCPAFEQHCAGYTIITEQGTDTATDLYYDGSGALVARVHTEPSGALTCSGPATFTAPACASASTMLAACGGS